MGPHCQPEGLSNKVRWCFEQSCQLTHIQHSGVCLVLSVCFFDVFCYVALTGAGLER